MQTLTSSEKVYPGIDPVDVVFFFSLILLYPPFTLPKTWQGVPYPFHTERFRSREPKDTRQLYIKPGKAQAVTD